MNSTTLTLADVKHIAHLGHLTLTDEELVQFQKQLSDTLSYVQQLEQVDTQRIEPTAQVTGLENVFRDDDVQPSLSQEEALSNAPSTHNGFVMVKAILEDHV